MGISAVSNGSGRGGRGGRDDFWVSIFLIRPPVAWQLVGAVEANVCINYVSRKSPEVLVINIFFASALSGAISAREWVCVCVCLLGGVSVVGKSAQINHGSVGRRKGPD